jgi:hypothetical protein
MEYDRANGSAAWNMRGNKHDRAGYCRHHCTHSPSLHSRRINTALIITTLTVLIITTLTVLTITALAVLITRCRACVYFIFGFFF